jgi:acetyl-CoA synthetase
MSWSTITKPSDAGPTLHNVADYEAARATFDWTAAAALLDGLPGGRGINIAHEAVDRHAAGPLADRVALRCIDRAGARHDLTYGGLAAATNRFANVLRDLGVEQGARVFTLTGRIPPLYVAAMGTLKARCVLSPLFSAFGPEPVRQRLELGDGRVLVTTAALYRRKVQPVRDRLPGLRHILVVDADEVPEGTLSLDALMATAPDTFTIGPTDAEDLALLHFTSGTTGMPKGALHVHGAVVGHHATAAMALDLRSDDVFWCTADPGWVTGTSYGIIAPLTHGVTSIVDEREFDAERWYALLESERVTVWYTAPTAVRMLMRAGAEPARAHDLGALRFVASVGEPLNPEAVLWGQEVLGMPIHDNWWQTETGGIMIANLAASEVRPGSMGRPLPGIEASVLAQGDDGELLLVEDHPVVVDQPDIEGQLALRRGWPSMFRGYLNAPERYQKCFAGDWYLTGDLVRRDADGFFWFVGRSDDVIKSAGHLIGPFEVESVLMEHPAVVEAGVIGKPDPVAGDVIKAFVSLRAGHEPSEELRLDLIGFARKRLGPAVAPREIDFDQNLPKTRSGKIMRRLLRARELGLPEGDLSTLEGAS